MKKRSQLKFYALTGAVFVCSSMAMENQSAEGTSTSNNNNAEKKPDFDINKFVELYKGAYKIDKNRYASDITDFKAALNIWSILNKKENVTEAQFMGLLKIISLWKHTDANELNDAFDYVFISGNKANSNKSSGIYQQDLGIEEATPGLREQERKQKLREMKNEANKRLLEILVAKGADINFNKVPDNKVVKMSSSFSSHSGGSLLHRAARENSVDWINFLIDKMGADINNKDIKHRTPIVIACKGNNLEAVEALLSRKNIDINLADSDKHTPLYWAVKNENFDMTELLLANGAKLEQAEDSDMEEREEKEEVKKTSKKSGFWSLFGFK